MTAGAPTVSVSELATRRPVEPSRTVDETEVTAPETRTESWSQKLYAALPLFIVGAGCLAVAIDLYYSGVTTRLNGSTVRLYPWVLFLALAVTGIAAGIFALLLEEEEPTAAGETSASAAPPESTAPLWDESMLEPTEPTYVHPRTWERYPELPTEVGWTPAEPRVERLPPDVVLVQIDEIEASLKKKSRPPGSG